MGNERETLEILSNPETMEAIREYEANPHDVISDQELENKLRNAGRIKDDK